MDRATLLGHLAKAEWHVTEGDRYIARQREVVKCWAGNDRRAADADGILDWLLETQAQFLAERDRLRVMAEFI